MIIPNSEAVLVRSYGYLKRGNIRIIGFVFWDSSFTHKVSLKNTLKFYVISFSSFRYWLKESLYVWPYLSLRDHSFLFFVTLQNVGYHGSPHLPIPFSTKQYPPSYYLSVHNLLLIYTSSLDRLIAFPLWHVCFQ